MYRVITRLTAAAFTFCLGLSLNFALTHDYASEVLNSKCCHVHGAVMRLEKVPVVAGMGVGIRGYQRATRDLFPNAHTVIRSGSCTYPLGKTKAVWVCQSCRAARLAWFAEKGKLYSENLADENYPY